MTTRLRSFLDVLELGGNRDRQVSSAEKWRLSDIPLLPKAALIVDVYNSRSTDSITEHYSEAALGVDVAAYSYAGPGEHFTRADTQQRLELSATLLSLYLPTPDKDNRVVPVGISGGGAVALLGSAKWISASNLLPSDLAKRVPGLILVAPALSPAPEIFAEYEERKVNQRLPVPECIRQLCNVGSQEWIEVQRELASAFALVQWAGIPIYVVYWPNDVLTPYPWDQHLYSVARPFLSGRELPLSPANLSLPPEDDPSYEREGAWQHLQFCKHPGVVAQVRGCIQQLI